MLRAVLLLSLLLVSAHGANEACSERCGCLARDTIPHMWHAARVARHTAASVETGMLAQDALEAVQARASDMVQRIGALGGGCAAKECGRRLQRLHNQSWVAQRRLDDAAVGALFGDSETNLAQLSIAAQRIVATATRTAKELMVYSKRCPAAGRGSGRGRGGRGLAQRGVPPTDAQHMRATPTAMPMATPEIIEAT